MSIKPILFNTEMVRAILDGRKSCTRRLVKPEPQGYFEVNEEPLYIYDTDGNQGKITPLYHTDDILYVRETWHKDKYRYMYRANYSENEKFYRDGVEVKVKWHPSIHMPKEAARIWLKVTNVRVERLQDMTDNDALREGAEGVRCNHAALGVYGCPDCMNTGWLEPPLLEFTQIWDSTIKKSDLGCYGWDANPWVWVIEFEECEKPI